MKKKAVVFSLFFCFAMICFAAMNISKEFQKIGNTKKSVEEKSKDYKTLMDAFEKALNKARNKSDKQKSLRDEVRTELNKSDSDGLTPIFYALIGNNSELVYKMLEYGADCNCLWNYDGAKNLTPLFLCLFDEENIDLKILKLILDKTSQERINTRTIIEYDDEESSVKIESTALAYLFRIYIDKPSESKKDAIKLLIENKADVNASIKINEEEFTPLFLTVGSSIPNDEKIALTKLLLENGAKPNDFCTIEDDSGSLWQVSAFHLAAKNNDSDLYNLLKNHGGDKNLPDSKEKSAFDYKKENIKSIADRLEFSYEESGSKNATFFLKDYNGSWESFTGDYSETTSYKSGKLNMAQIAIKYGDEESAAFLLNGKIPWDRESADGLNSLDYAFKYNREEIIKYFLDKKVLIGKSLFSAIDNELQGNESFIRAFLEIYGKNINKSKFKKDILKNNSIISLGPVTYTVSKNDEAESKSTQNIIKVLNQLMDFGFDINETVDGGYDDGNTALILASKNKDAELVEFLIEKGADQTIQSKSKLCLGRTAIFYALENNAPAVLSVLSKNFDYKDIQLNGSDDKNSTLLMFIARYGDFDFVNSVIPEMISRNKYSLEKQDSNGFTSFLYAAAYNDDFRIMKLFRMYGANVYAKDFSGNDAYDIANKNKNDEEVLYRLETYGVYGK